MHSIRKTSSKIEGKEGFEREEKIHYSIYKSIKKPFYYQRRTASEEKRWGHRRTVAMPFPGSAVNRSGSGPNSTWIFEQKVRIAIPSGCSLGISAVATRDKKRLRASISLHWESRNKKVRDKWTWTQGGYWERKKYKESLRNTVLFTQRDYAIWSHIHVTLTMTHHPKGGILLEQNSRRSRKIDQW